MKKFCWYIIATLTLVVMSGCSAAYWSGASFEGDDMYDTHHATVAPSKTHTTTSSYAAYQRPESYYQYRYGADGEDSVLMVEPKYISSTYNIWDEEQIAASNIYVSYSYNPWWGYRYDPFYYYGWWGYPSYYYGYPYYRPYYYYGWYRPHMPHVSHRPRRTNIVTRPSTSAPSLRSSSSRGVVSSPSSSSSRSYRGQSVGTTTSNTYKRATTTFSPSSSSSSSQSRSSSGSTSSSSSSTNSSR